jgi:phage shock protein PspC (stress-responsive transcriptional regulator)
MLLTVSATERSSSAGFEEMMRDFVATRPRRPRSGRVVAGVAAGIGRRYGIDPVIVRVALVVAVFYGGGAGLVCYLLGWLLLAQDGDEVSPFEALLGRGTSSTSRRWSVVLCVGVGASFASTSFGDGLNMVLGLLVLGAGLFLLHRYRADQGQITPVTTSIHPEAGYMTDSMPTSQFGPGMPMTDPDGPQDAVPHHPPAWDPLGAAPFAWDLPEPAPAPQPAPPALSRPHRPRITLATLGVLLVTGAVLGVLSSSTGWLNPGHIAGVLAAITGVGLVTGAFVHAGRGLLPVAVLASLAAFGLTATHFQSWHGAGNSTFRPTTIAAVQPQYQRSVGHFTLDLSALPDTGTVTTRVNLNAGDLTVLVPATAEVNATCSTGVGDVDCLGQHTSGPGNPTIETSQQATAGSQLTINISAQDGAGKVSVIQR